MIFKITVIVGQILAFPILSLTSLWLQANWDSCWRYIEAFISLAQLCPWNEKMTLAFSGLSLRSNKCVKLLFSVSVFAGTLCCASLPPTGPKLAAGLLITNPIQVRPNAHAQCKQNLGPWVKTTLHTGTGGQKLSGVLLKLSLKCKKYWLHVDWKHRWRLCVFDIYVP